MNKLTVKEFTTIAERVTEIAVNGIPVYHATTIAAIEFYKGKGYPISAETLGIDFKAVRDRAIAIFIKLTVSPNMANPHILASFIAFNGIMREKGLDPVEVTPTDFLGYAFETLDGGEPLPPKEPTQ